MYEFFVCFTLICCDIRKKSKDAHGNGGGWLLGRSVGCLCLGLVGWIRRSLSLFLDWETCEQASNIIAFAERAELLLMLFGMGLSLVWSDLVAYASIATSSRR